MSWLEWISVAATVGINLHAVAALVLSRGKTAPAVSQWARRSGWFFLAYVGLFLVVIALVVRGGVSAVRGADPSMRAEQLARQISEGMNCAAVFFLGSVLPGSAAIRLWWKTRRAAL